MIRNKKGGFNIQNYLIGALIMMGIMVTFGNAAGNMIKHYTFTNTTSTVDSDFLATYDKISTITDETETMEASLDGDALENDDVETAFYGGALSSVNVIKGSFGVAKEMVKAMVRDFNIPEIWGTIFATVIVILILTTIIFMIFKHRGD